MSPPPDFNPRPPRGGRLPECDGFIISIAFQSTPPARGATRRCRCRSGSYQNFNPRPPRGGRLVDKLLSDMRKIISIHAPREGGDVTMAQQMIDAELFQSTPPARGATGGFILLSPPIRNFNPRPPRGGRLTSKYFLRIFYRFQSTPPARGATQVKIPPAQCIVNFNPRPPRGGRRQRNSGWYS